MVWLIPGAAGTVGAMTERLSPTEQLTSPAPSTRSDRRAWLGLLVVLGPVLLVAMDNSILHLAMPRISESLSPSAGQALWILDVYGFVVGSLLITFGSVGDRYGRLRLMTVGAVVFGAASAGAALSSSPEALIAFRALMGIGGATLLPSGLAVISELFRDPRRRAQAIGIFAATFATGFAIGPVTGGLLLSVFPWGSVFLINLPVVVLFLVFAPTVLREVRGTRPGRVDVLSVVLSSAGLLLTVYTLKDAASHGLGWHQALTGLAGIALVWWFLRRQHRLEHPLVELGLFRERVFAFAIVTGLLSLLVWAAASYLTGIYLQSVLGLDVLTAALLAVPGALVLTVTCVVTPRFFERIGRRIALAAAHLFAGAGLALLLLAGTESGVGWFVASTMIAGIGYGISFSAVADVAVSAVPPERAGAAAAIAETSNELGNALGISLLGATAALVFRLSGPDVAGTLNETLAVPGLAEGAAESARAAFLSGMHVAVVIGSAVSFAVGLLILRLVPRAARVSQAAPASRRVR
ncbi:MFS transporter [Nocardiopsis exhalans]